MIETTPTYLRPRNSGSPMRAILGLFAGIPAIGGGMFDLALMSAAINLLSLAVPLATMQVYDRIIPNQTMPSFYWLATGALIALALEGLLRWLRSAASSWLAARFEHIVSCNAVRAILQTPMVGRRHAVGDHVDAMGGIAGLGYTLVGQLAQSLLDLPFALLFIVAIAYLAPSLAWIPIGFALAYGLFIAFARGYYHTAKLRQEETRTRRYNLVIHLMQSLHLIKAQALEEPLLRRHEKIQAETAVVNLDAGFWSRLPQDLGGSFNQLATLIVIALGATMVSSGQMTLGALSACMMLTGRSLTPIQGLLNFWLRSTEAFLAQERLEEILAAGRNGEKSELPPFPNDILGTLEVRDLHFRHAPDQPWLFQGLNLEVAGGTLLAISGPSGAGTTTLLRLLAGLYAPEKGTVAVGNCDLSQWDLSDMRGRIAYVPPNGTMFRGTILENLTMFQSELKLAALEAASLLGLDEVVSLLPSGYETEIDANSFLPKAIIQRIVIARALVVRPRVLILDDPTASMDADTEGVLIWLLKKLQGRCTVVLGTTAMHLSEMADMQLDLETGLIQVRMRDDWEPHVRS